jgi:hypothetical protein
MDNPPPNLPPAPNQIVQLSPYTGSDADMIIARVEQRNARSPSARSDISTAPGSVNLANVSPAVSLMLLAAVNAGPPGAMNGIGGMNSIGAPNGFQGMTGHAYGFSRRDSQTSLRSVGSQASFMDAYGIGASASGYGLGVGTGMNMGGLSASSSWANISPQFIPTTLNPYNDYPAAPSPRIYHVTGKHTTATPSTRHGLEHIAEVSSREEMSRAGSQECVPAPAHTPSGTTSNPAEPSPYPAPPISHKDNLNMGEVTHSPSSELPFGRVVSPGPSPTLSKKASMDSLVKSFSDMAVSSSSEGSATGDGLRTPPEQGTTGPPSSTKGTPPRIGNPGKRMLSHALGIRHPSLPPRVIAGVKEQAA